jgi:hypothetical protein
MAKYIYIQLFAPLGGTAPPPLKIRADKIETGEAGKMTLKIGNEQVGEFQTSAIQGWWIEDH